MERYARRREAPPGPELLVLCEIEASFEGGREKTSAIIDDRCWAQSGPLEEMSRK